jgi:hypothetical protein
MCGTIFVTIACLDTPPCVAVTTAFVKPERSGMVIEKLAVDESSGTVTVVGIVRLGSEAVSATTASPPRIGMFRATVPVEVPVEPLTATGVDVNVLRTAAEDLTSRLPVLAAAGGVQVGVAVNVTVVSSGTAAVLMLKVLTEAQQIETVELSVTQAAAGFELETFACTMWPPSGLFKRIVAVVELPPTTEVSVKD